MARRTTPGGAALACLLPIAGACAGEGSVSLRFDVPDDFALRPDSAETLTLVARVGDDAPRATTATIGDGSAIDLGDLPIDDEIWLSAEMRTGGEQLVGYGQAAGPITVAAEAVTEATIPVRRPFVYLAGSGNRLVSLDASVPSTLGYQGAVGTSGAPTVVADVAGTDVATITATGALSYISTTNHLPSSRPAVSLPPMPVDAIATLDGMYLIVGHGGAMAQVSVVDIAAGTFQVAPMPSAADRVAVTRGSDGGWWVVALINRATTDTGCTASRLATFPLDDPETATLVDATVGISDISGDTRSGLVVVADRCGDRVLRFDPVAGSLDFGAPVMTIAAPTTVAASDQRVWAVGHDILPGSMSSVPDGIVDAWLILGSAGIDGSEPQVEPLAPVVERVLATMADFPDQDITQDLHANSVVADDLAILPGAEQLALTVRVVLHGDELSDPFFGTIVPEMDVDTQEYWLVDASNRVTTQRLRTRCDITVGTCDLDSFLCDWDCLPDLDVPDVGEFSPTCIAALFGAR